jgi:hypothetical protein
LVFTPTSALLFSKTTSLINLLRSGQLQAKKGGQFGAKIYGQLPAESSDLFKRNFQPAIEINYDGFDKQLVFYNEQQRQLDTSSQVELTVKRDFSALTFLLT